jgi:hypothetical protein
MKLINFWAMLIGLLLACNVQAVGYTASITTAYPALTISTSAPQVAWTSVGAYAICDDCVSTVMPIGFAFTFAGTIYNNWSMSSNGVIFFETASTGNSTGGTSYTPTNLPSTGLGSPAKAALMPFWADLQHNASAAGANNVGQPANASFYQYQVLTQPSGAQVLVVQLKNVNFWNSGGVYVNMQVQIWSTGQIVYSYGGMQATTAALRIGLQSAGGTYCHTLASNQTTALSNQSFLYQWDLAAAACAPQTVVNHYEIRKDTSATLCAEPVAILACSVATTPCPAASIMSSTSSPALISPITAQLTITGTGVTNVTQSPPSVNIQPSAPLQNVNLIWASGSAGTATLAISASVAASGTLKCTDAAGTAASACTMAVANLACVPAPHHFEVQGPASGTTCANSTFTIKAWVDAAQTIAYTTGAATGTLSASGNAASIPTSGAFTIPAGSSTVSITPISFPAAGTSTFTTTTTPALTGTTTCNFGGSTSCAFVVGSCVGDFNCVESTTGGASAADSNSSTGRLYTKLAGTAFSIDVVARKGDGTVDPTYASGGAKSVTVELVDGSGATACASRTALSPAVSLTQNFVAGDAGRKSYSFTVANAYQNVRCRVNDTTTVPAIAKACSVDNFAIRPSAVTLAATSANAANAAPPPAANAATATPMVKAGTGFTLQASTTTGVNYVGTLTQDSSKLTAQITTQATSAAAGGAVGALTPTTLATNASPQPTNNATYSEVGYLYLAAGAFYDNTFTAVDSAATPTVINDCVAGSFADTLVGGKYGCNIGNTATVSLGRFVPDHFDTAIVQATAPIACPSGMTCPGSTPMAMGLLYANQPLAMKVTAKNAIGTGGTTTNYQGVFAKANTLSAWSAAGSAGTANPGSGTLASTSVAASSFTAGVASAQPSYALGTTTTAPVDAYFRAIDVDAISSLRTGSVEGGVKVANGRIRLPNAYGSEKLALPLTATVQYFDGANWVTSATDSTTSFNSNLTTASGNVVVSILNGLGSGLAIVSPALGTFTSGVRAFNLAAPGAAGNANVSLNTPSYLPSATSRATFGIFRSPLLYRRENY